MSDLEKEYNKGYDEAIIAILKSISDHLSFSELCPILKEVEDYAWEQHKERSKK